MFNIIIIGGEQMPNYELFQKKCIFFLRSKATSGERIRVLTIGDEFVTKFCSKFGIETKTILCDWQKYGKDAIFLRNKELVSGADAIIYFDSNIKDLDGIYKYALHCKLDNRRVVLDELITP